MHPIARMLECSTRILNSNGFVRLPSHQQSHSEHSSKNINSIPMDKTDGPRISYAPIIDGPEEAELRLMELMMKWINN